MLMNEQAGDGRYDEIVKNAETFALAPNTTRRAASRKTTSISEALVTGPARRRARPVEHAVPLSKRSAKSAPRRTTKDPRRARLCVALPEPRVGRQRERSDKVERRRVYHTFVSGQENPAGQEASGGLRSYGSITYAGLKSLIYAGLTADDPRVAAATNWIRDNYSMTQNPGLGKKGLYYYYHTLSKCFQVLGEPTFKDKSGVEHDWRSELIETLALAENADGSWVNEDRMWFESDANLVTGYVLIVLSYCAEEGADE